MGALHKIWTDAKKKVKDCDALFKDNLGGALDKAENTYLDYKKYEDNLEKVVTNVDKVKVEAEKAEKLVKSYFTTLQNAKTKPSKPPVPFPDNEKIILKTALNDLAGRLAAYIAEVKNKKMPTLDEVNAWRGKHTKGAIKEMGL
ncbi:MAG: hypothetical protein SFY69_06880 [Planctomycetota bacterium]|nr:hypothetical protein [Planctomycetota bacterium]